MNEQLNVRGPAVDEDSLIDVYRTQRDVPSPWVAISDQVMGGISSARLQQRDCGGSASTCLTGRTSLENNGGFVQMKLDIGPAHSLANFRGLFIELYGVAHEYDLRVKTSQLDKPWQSFRCKLQVAPQWTRFTIPYTHLRAHRTDAALDPSQIRSIAVVAIGEEFDVDVCVRRAGFFL
ncbi:CIA30 family protein [Halopseudomonas sp.]|uniref:CIA30 family protein n=1 Tax=Halopseudomonas sp. TaxID=2901191 RepID=UPI0035648494